MEEQLISFETAKLAKAKGFNIRMLNIYPMEDFFGDYKTGELSFMLEESFDEDFAWEKGYFAFAPTQSLLKKWFREVHKVDVDVAAVYVEMGDKQSYRWQVDILDLQELDYYYHGIEDFKLGFLTYEVALEVGLKKALELI